MLTLAKKGEIRTSPRPNVHLGNGLHTQNTRSFLNWWKVWGPWYFKKMNACSWDILGKTSKIAWLKMTRDLFGDSITVRVIFTHGLTIAECSHKWLKKVYWSKRSACTFRSILQKDRAKHHFGLSQVFELSMARLCALQNL